MFKWAVLYLTLMKSYTASVYKTTNRTITGVKNKIMKKDKNHLYVIAVISNAAKFESRYRIYKEFEKHISTFQNVTLVTAELAYGDAKHMVTSEFNKNHIQVRTEDAIWHKENLINVAIKKLPADWEYVAWVDADLTFINPNWVQDTIDSLQKSTVTQMFTSLVDMDADCNIMYIAQSFGKMFHDNKYQIPPDPVNPLTKKVNYTGGIYTAGEFWHPGYAWAARRDFIDHMDGVFDLSILGSGDHLMALSFIGAVSRLDGGTLPRSYMSKIKEWEKRIFEFDFKGVGYVNGILAHHFHGKKSDRGYETREKIYEENKFDVDTDLSRDRDGLLHLVVKDERQVKLRDDIMEYFKSRKEDSKES